MNNVEKMKKKAAKLKNPTPVLLPSGKWRCQVTVSGERISFIDDDPEVAHTQAKAIKLELINDKPGKKSSMTLERAFENYIDIRRGVLSPSTIRSYNDTKKNRLLSLWGKKVNDIDESDLQLAITIEAKNGKSAKTIRNDISLVVAIVSDYKSINAKKLKFPQRVKKEHAYLDTDQIITVIDACVGDRAEIPILLALWLGMRRSEILGLHWESVDFDNKVISIEHACVRDENQKFIIKPYLKNESSRRKISCPDYILDKLEKFAKPELREGRVFKTNDSSFIYDRLKIICDREGIPFPGVHGLRHTNASVMLSLGVVDKAAMARNGWSTDYTMKQVYHHLFSKDKEDADKKIDNYFMGMIENLHT